MICQTDKWKLDVQGDGRAGQLCDIAIHHVYSFIECSLRQDKVTL